MHSTSPHGRFLGKKNYASPESLLDNRVSFKCDTWSIGVVCYELLLGKMPVVVKGRFMQDEVKTKL